MQDDPRLDGLLGDLERRVMDAVWARGQASVREVQEDLAGRDGPAYTTVMTVMSRLADKGILTREKRGRAFLYRPAQPSSASFARRQARLRVRALLDQLGDVAIAGIVDELGEGSAEEREALAELVDELREREGGHETGGTGESVGTDEPDEPDPADDREADAAR